MEIGKTEVIELDADAVVAKISEMIYDDKITDAQFRFQCDLLISMFNEGLDGLFNALNQYTGKSE